MNEWLEDHAKLKSAVTYHTYQAQALRYILPGIGHFRVVQLASQHINALYRAMRHGCDALPCPSCGRTDAPKRSVSEATILKVHRQLKLIFKSYVNWDGVIVPRAERKSDDQHLDYHSEEEVTRLLQAAGGSPIYGLLLVALYTGLSKGELRGLQWRDLEGDTLTIRRTRQYRSGLGDLELPTKRPRRARPVLLEPEVLAALGPRHIDGRAWIFDITDARLHYWLSKVRLKAGLQGSKLHILRHTYAKMAFDTGSTVPEVSAAMGHSSPVVTLGVYSHVDPGRVRDVNSRVALALKKVGAKSEQMA